MEKQKKKFVMPHTYVILIAVIILMAICTYIIPAGEYARVEDPNTGRMVVDPDSFASVDANPTKPFDLVKSIPQGMDAACSIVFFIFIVGGSFNIIMSTGAIERGIGKVAIASRGKEKLLIPLVVFIFSIGGATFGMSEEAIAFIPIGVALARAVGYDAMVGCAIVSLGAAVGFNSAWMNPFTVGVAQGIAELPTFSGIELRLVIWAVSLVVTSLYIMRYASKIKKNPELSIVADIELQEKDNKIDLDNLGKMSAKDSLVLLAFVIGMLILVYGVFTYGWYFTEICALFITMGVVCGLIAGRGPSTMAGDFIAGAKDIVFGALVVGIARAVLVVMENGLIIDSVVHGLASVVSLLPKSIAAIGMMIVQVLINFFIPSGSGQAAVTMPIMAPLADILGMTRQTAVLAFQFGDGFTNSIIPTSATLMANLSIAKISYDRWVKFVAPLIGIWVVMGMAFMVIATVINYGPF